MGRTVRLDVSAALPGGKPAAGCLLLPYVNGKRWGAHEYADAQGRASFQLPLPQPGIVEIQVEILPPPVKWSGAPKRTDSQMTYAASIGQWAETDRRRLLVGTRPPEGAVLSNLATVRVDWRPLMAMRSDPEHLVGAQYCTLYTPQNFNWTTAQAVPLVGFYHSWDPDVLRQHLIWLVESGVDFLLVDWSNQLWDRQHWDERSDAANEIVHTTTMLLETAATMREQGLPVPRMVIFLGVTNGPSTTMTAVNEEIQWIYHNYVRNPRFHGLFLEYLGKPLLIVFNGGGPAWLKNTHQAAVDERYFTIRWMSAQHQASQHNKPDTGRGWTEAFGSRSLCSSGKPEALTVSMAFFDGRLEGGTAFGRRGRLDVRGVVQPPSSIGRGSSSCTNSRSLRGAEESSQPFYGDSYSVELSDDIEPVSLTTPAYRGNGGWGFHLLESDPARWSICIVRRRWRRQSSPSLSRPAGRSLAKIECESNGPGPASRRRVFR